MKIILLSALMCCAAMSYSQDSVKIRQIDSLVKVIDQSSWSVQNDSVSQDYPDLGLSMKNYLTMVLDGNTLKKYVNKGNSIRQEKGTRKEMTTSTTFFYDKDQLIKVEEFAISEGKEVRMSWYFSDDKSLYYTQPQSEKSDARANLLLTMSKGMLKQVQDRVK